MSFLFGSLPCKHKDREARFYGGNIFGIHCKKCGKGISNPKNPFQWETIQLFKNKEDYDL